MASITVQIGTKFHATYADGNPEWVVVSKAGRGAWRCRVTDDADWGGVVKLFSTDEIRRSLAMASFFNESRNKSKGFYGEAKLGSVVHYHNSFGEYVRCEVVLGMTAHSGTNKVKCLKPLALVGDWKSWDLPRRERDGSIYYGHQASSIMEGSCFEPHASNIWESPEFDRRGRPNPTKLPALDLSVPDMTPEENEVAKLEQLRRSVLSALENCDDVASSLRIAKGMLENIPTFL
jgi:hypothetical protein